MRMFTFWRVSIPTADGSSGGFAFYTTLAAAKRARDGNPNADDWIIRPIQVEASKRGILAALERFATHPDNG